MNSAIPVNAERIPVAMKAERRWVLWRYELKHDRQTKPPYTPDGYRARHNQSASWCTFVDVIDAYNRGGFDGLGFALGDGWAGFDFDKCLRAGNVLEQHAESFIERIDALGAYREVSPSGTGIKVIGRSARIGGEIKFDNGERVAFFAARFFAVTGALAMGDPSVDVTEVIHEWFPQALKPAFGDVPAFIRAGDTRGTENIDDRPLYPKLADKELVAAIMASAQAIKFRTLAKGDMSEYGGDHSRADQALVNILAYWSQNDADQIDRLFRKSGLMRDKWLTRSYCHATLLKAGVTEATIHEFLRQR
jgi:primase-polymerase (primpol)-like protein